MGVMISAAFAMSVAAPLGSAPAVDADPAGIRTDSDGRTVEAVPPPAYRIVDIPAFNREPSQRPLADRSMDAFHLEDTLPEPRAASPVLEDAVAIAPSDRNGAVSDHDTFNAAVVQAHDDRIALIERRIGQLRAKQIAPSDAVLVDLANRLQRARDARTVAASRAGSPVMAEPVLPSAATEEHGDAGQGDNLPAPIFAEPVVPVVVRKEKQPAKRMARQTPVPPVRSDAEPSIPTPIPVLASFIPAEQQAGRDDPAATLRRAREKLTEARQMLDDGAPVPAGDADPLDLSWSSPAGQLALALSALLLVCAVAQNRRNPLPVSA
ncbi:hypothetical protein NYR55_04155 [Sphingomonas sp. BGYR3]|uniref:hypothetical protein n=1 Tax=Sphingomonas sp. BGYR3 TaxID=2975483 RepID=UPI0021A575AF|nr:hypothetical protein [Sphingomonas sp. BGYR3]MDG5487813.1 hypothetical protein [Sphingomonas sp. BGYR3]